MDQTTVDRLKAAGFDDNDIAEYAKAHTTDNGPINPAQAQPNEMPSVPFDPNNVPNTIAPPNTPTQNAGEGLMGVGKILEHPITHVIEGGLGGLYAVNKLANALASRGATPPVTPAPAPVTPPTTPPATFTNGANPAWDQALKQPYQAPANPATTQAGRPFSPQAQQYMQQRAMPPTTAPSAPPQSSNFIQRMAGLAEQYAPLLRSAGVAAAGMAPATLNKNEDQLLQEKHRLEMQMLLNKHSSEWNKYKNAQQVTQGQ